MNNCCLRFLFIYTPVQDKQRFCLEFTWPSSYSRNRALNTLGWYHVKLLSWRLHKASRFWGISVTLSCPRDEPRHGHRVALSCHCHCHWQAQTFQLIDRTSRVTYFGLEMKLPILRSREFNFSIIICYKRRRQVAFWYSIAMCSPFTRPVYNFSWLKFAARRFNVDTSYIIERRFCLINHSSLRLKQRYDVNNCYFRHLWSKLCS